MEKENIITRENTNPEKSKSFLDKDSAISITVVSMLIAASVWITKSKTESEAEIVYLKEQVVALNTTIDKLKEELFQNKAKLENTHVRIEHLIQDKWTKQDDLIFMQLFSQTNNLKMPEHSKYIKN